MTELQTSDTKEQPQSDQVLAEAFSIGLTILDAGLLTDNSDLYNMKSYKFDIEKAKEKLRIWSQSTYSDTLRRIVLNMC
jgi:hypothetical protein